ncbi:ras-related and estrogen-regulated growth inhibitor-like [Mercenaria mercenaria]|uniref:ras-related and estrogen-regulated growth inhibitor-like n=1 Tax=Mercenaria mercenaria TaxID=6596 RepID=UPI00234EAB95|nr:ras-related and estrogen-regulated growth inhibitor-like [Mercenaria mercenaria]
MSQKRFTGAKIVLLGSSGVGKTAFAVRYITKRYIGDYDRDKEMLYTHKLQTARDEVTLEILDTASQPSRENLEKHIKWGDGFILLYSLTEKSSLTYLDSVKDAIEKNKGRECPLVLVANKSDLMSAREIADDECNETGERFDCQKFEISVADGSQGVFEVMDEILCQLKREYIKNLNSGNVSPTDGKAKSKLYSMKKAFKKRINRSHSDTF